MAEETITPILAKGRRARLYQGIFGQCLAEFMGTAVLILLGCGSVAVAVVGLPGTDRTSGPTTFFEGSGDWLIIVWGCAFAVAFGVYISQGVSGAHLNPGVTLGFAVRRKFPWKHVIPYWIAQVAGAIMGAAMVYWLYKDAIRVFDEQSETFAATGHTIPTLSIFSTGLLMNMILSDKAHIADAVNATKITLDEAPEAYQKFDAGAAHKYVIDPHGMVG